MVLPHSTGDLYHKYRPLKFGEIAGHKELVTSIKQAVISESPSQAYLLIGDSGTGKTTLARIMAMSLNCENRADDGEPCLICPTCRTIISGNCIDLVELNAADNRGIGDIRSICRTMPLLPMQLDKKVYILDECFPSHTLIMSDYGKAITIEEAVENENVTHVLAYDLDGKNISRKKILNRYKRPYDDKLVKISFSEGNFVDSTRQHNYYVCGKGYIPAEDVVPGDKLIEYSGEYTVHSACPHCNWVCEKKKGALSAHIMKEHRDQTNHTTYTDSVLGSKRSDKVKANLSKNKLEFYATERGIALKKERSLAQMGSSNTIFKYMTPSEVTTLHSTRQKKWWRSMPADEREWRIKTFINAPKYNYLPNKVEKKVIDWDVSGLKYVGDGSLFLTLTLSNGKQIHKNPDFVYKENGKVSKIIEVMDFEYWHTHSEADEVVAAYKKLGYPCMVVDAARIHKNQTAVRGEIEAFTNNHYVEVVSVEVAKRDCQRTYVYDIEVEDDHNFFVVPAKYKKSGSPETLGRPVLVSNCHQLTNEAQSSLLKVLEEAPPHVFIILCSTHPKKILPTVKNRCQKYIFSSLRRTEMLGLLEEITVLEGEDLPRAAYEAITDATGGSPRAAIVQLQQVLQLGSKSLPDIMRMVGGEEAADKNVIQLCFSLNSKAPWAKVVETFNEVKHMGAPAIGMVAAGFFRNQLLKAKGEQIHVVAAKLEMFLVPFVDGKLGENQLVHALYRAKHGK